MQKWVESIGFHRVGRWLTLAGAAVFAIGTPSPVFCAFNEALWGARPAAMAGAYTALADDANAPAYNPAGVAYLEESEMTLMYAQLFTGVNFQAGDDTSRLGLGYFSYVPVIQERRFGSYAISWTNFVATNLYREDSFSISVADAYLFESLPRQPIVSYGANIKYLRRSFSTDTRTDADPVFQGGRDAGAATADIGLMAHPRFTYLPGLKIGLSAQNITEPDLGLAATDRVPARYTVGLAYQDPRFKFFTPSLDVSRRNGRTLVSAGWEGSFVNDTLAFRLGGNEDQFAAGMGYQFDLFTSLTMRLDYALLWPFDVAGTNGSHRVSISTNF